MPKAKKKHSAPPAAKSLAANRRRRRARTTITKTTREVRETRQNPAGPGVGDLTHVVLPGFAAYAGTRIVQRMVFTVVAKRWPNFAKHAHALAGAATFGAAWFFAHRIKRIANYHDGIIVGSGVAALQGVAQCYLPTKYSWLLADCSPDDVTPIDPNAVQPLPSAATQTDGDEYSYLEEPVAQVERSSSKRTRTVRGPKPSRTPVANAMKMATAGQDLSNVTLDPDLLQELGDDEAIDSLYSGAFSTN